MKKQTHTNLLIRSSLALALALAIWSPLQGQPMEGMMENKMMERCQKMKEQKEKMMAEMKAQDAELNERVAKMNSAPENERMALMAAVLTQMVGQQTAMHARMERMQAEMMQHMMQHMQMGKESMSQCPMMKGMMDMKDKSASDHKEHHEEQK